jgi:hypothetical protein
MSAGGSTMLDVAKKRPTSGKPPNRTPAYTIYARVDAKLGEAFEEYLRRTEPSPTLKSAIELMMRKFLTSEGLWPPPRP